MLLRSIESGRGLGIKGAEPEYRSLAALSARSARVQAAEHATAVLAHSRTQENSRPRCRADPEPAGGEDLRFGEAALRLGLITARICARDRKTYDLPHLLAE